MNGQEPLPKFEKPKKPISMDILFIGVISLLAVGSWAIFDIYRAATVTTVPQVLQRQIRPIQSEIDDELLSDIRSRRRFSETELLSVTPPIFIPLDERTGTEAESTALPVIIETAPEAPAATTSATPATETAPPGADTTTTTETEGPGSSPPTDSAAPVQ
jgi:cytoskeletal protein RodZ